MRYMPVYQLICNACGEAFETLASISAKERGEIACPACGAHEVRTNYESGRAVNLRVKESGEACPHREACGCQGGCCHH